MSDGMNEGKVRQRKSHRILVTLLLIVGTLLTPITITALFVHTELTDTSRYVQNVAPLASDPAVQSYIADDVTNRLFAQVDVASYVREVLPPRAERIVGPLTSAMRGFVHEATLKVLQSSQFQKAWEAANRVAHTQLVRVLEGSGNEAIKQTRDGVVTLDLSAVVSQVIEQLKSTGIDLFSKIPIVKIGGQIPLFQSKDLYQIRKATDLFDKIAFVLPFLVLGCFAGAVYLSRNRRKGFLAAALCFALGALMLGIALTVGRHLYLNAATSAELPQSAASAIFDTLVRFLRTSIRAALILSVIVIIAVIFSGPSRLANGFRVKTRQAVNYLGRETDRMGWGWFGAHNVIVRNKGKLRVLTAVVAFTILFFWKHPTPVVIFWTGVITLAVLALIEFLGREPLSPEPNREITLNEPATAISSTGSTV